jgi:uncharacterized membrane protein
MGDINDREELTGLGRSGAGSSATTGDSGNLGRGDEASFGGASMGDAGAATARERERRKISKLFRDRESAERAYQSLRERGYSDDDVNVLMSDETRKKHFGDSDLGNKALQGAGVGALAGGMLGVTLGALAALGTTIVLPGFGLVIAGPIAAALAGGAAGAATGSLIGALVGYGIPEERAKEYEEGIREGGIVLIVSPRDAADEEFFEREWA